MNKYEVLCYGDSNTWGCIPRWNESELPSERYGSAIRWPSVTASLLGSEYHLIAEGLGGRTTIYDRPEGTWLNGLTYLKPCLLSHRPLDLVAIMLGTNDLIIPNQPKIDHMGNGIKTLVELIRETPKCGRENTPPKVLVISPIPIKPALGRLSVYNKFRRETGKVKSEAFAETYRQVAEETGSYYLDASKFAFASDADGVHFTPEAHLALANQMAETIRNCLGKV